MFGIELPIGIIVALVVLVFFLINSIKILPEYERGVVFRLGRLRPNDYGPGIFFLIPIMDRMVRVSLRTVVHDVPPQDIITRDNVSVKVNAVVYYRVMNPRRAIVEVENFHYATSQLSQTTLRSVLGQVDLDTLLSERDRLNLQLQTILDKHTDPWGIKVSAVEVKHVDLPVEMQRAMAKQAEAEREKRAKIIHAEGERQAATALGQAAELFGANPITLQLRYLQTLTEVASEKNSTLVFPLPIDIIRPFLERK
ncbi:MAG TPA: slipin family protein [Candidatus Polarisedimenticolaceae bacterium]|nr:slipin family protein [Candidatus Polarisedimenticolaceae bacterium]